ncbi:major head protein (endogenous virus) [Clostridium phage phiCTC2B]|uniref:Phage protein n=1 Tax=Clostridium tetani (strain Massachusetts / E88) TaxID=212717 RepID=Q892H0_CLOTE|nr:phage major capsid protein [Clostridium tetani]YP_009276932.1 major head protein [Clostridium phage phiCT19406B]YP_009277376.1 major head protein [Clostridium phage phiCTC2B]AAO36625.1 phage protein [Clostridium tetani E88]AJA42792.1 major capsid protein [Clostridium phage phiCT19406B]AJA42988.1 major capsid protein [Clostridium phage phiCTC2B]KGI39114.1 capsid protein [Clostridium tetani]KGI43683.1 capsid protein [Clostridium tetani]
MLKSIEMKQELEILKNEAKALLENKEAKLEDIKAKNEAIEILQAKIVMQEKLEQEEKEKVENKVPKEPTPVENDYTKEFINGLRTKFKNSMSEGSAGDGGYIVPQDISTAINELRQSKDALQNLITVEPVQTLSGSRVFKSRSQQTGFAEVAESGEIKENATPKFTQLPYSVKKYAGFFKVTNELLKDNDQAIRGALIKWIGDESRVTRNKLILAELNKKPKTAIAKIDDIKDVLNVQLDPAFRYTSSIVTNQDGYNYLDKLKDTDGDYLLQPSITAPSGKQLFGVPIIVISNKDLPSDTTDGTKAPVIIGDLKEAVVMFDRETLSVMASDVAGDAYLTDVTLFRAIEREEVKTRDGEAFVYGQLTIK